MAFNLWNFNSSSSMFGSGSSTNLYSLFSERNAIKSGAYKKLLKSYYSSLEGDSDSAADVKRKRGSNNVLDSILRERMYPTVSKETQETNSKLTSGLNSLKSSVSALQNESTYEDTENGSTAVDKVVSAVKSYVTNYNNVVKASKTSTLSNKTAYVANMMSATSKNADQLAEIGVRLNKDGTLMLNESKLKETDVEKVQKLFSPDNIQSYGSTIASRTKFASSGSAANTGAATGDTATDTKKPTGTSAAAALKADSKALASDELYAKVKDKDGNETEDYNISKILSTAKSFVSNYNKMFDTAESSANSGVLSNLSYIRERTANNSKALKEFGFSVDKKGRMKLDEDTFKKADMSEVQKFFKDYGSFVAGNASRVDYYMNTKANAASGYTSKASYNIPSSSDYNASI